MNEVLLRELAWVRLNHGNTPGKLGQFLVAEEADDLS